MIRVGLIGAGYMMQVTHLMSLRAIAGIQLVAIADLDTALAEQVARANGIPRVYPSADALVEREADLDAVVVVTRKEHHLAAALPALERGIATLIEKPLASSMEDGRRLVEAAERTGAILMVGYMKRYDPAVRELTRLLQENALGELRYVQIHDFGGNWTVGAPRLGAFPINEATATPGPIRPRPPAADPWTEAFNEWLEVWSHDVNLARALFGEPQTISYASAGLPRLVQVECATARVLLETGPLTYPGGEWDERITIYGSKGRAEVSFPAPLLFRQASELVVRTSVGEQRPRLVDRESFTEEMIHFLGCVQEGRQPMTSGRDALKDLVFCAQIVDVSLGRASSK